MSQGLLKNTWFCQHKNGWKLSRGHLRNIRSRLTSKCWDSVWNCAHWLGRLLPQSPCNYVVITTEDSWVTRWTCWQETWIVWSYRMLVHLCGLSSSRSPWWRGGHVAQVPPGDTSSCSASPLITLMLVLFLDHRNQCCSLKTDQYIFCNVIASQLRKKEMLSFRTSI